MTVPTDSHYPVLTLRQSDSTRAQDVELKIQSRVNSELTRIRDAGAQKLDNLTSSLTTNAPEEKSSQTEDTTTRDPHTLASHLSSPFYQDHSITSHIPGLSSTPVDSGRSHDSVNQEIMDLRRKLESRKKVEKTSPEVEKARESLVSCLRTNDRRPLDCWEEVEGFKREVGKLEKSFLERAGR